MHGWSQWASGRCWNMGDRSKCSASWGYQVPNGSIPRHYSNCGLLTACVKKKNNKKNHYFHCKDGRIKVHREVEKLSQCQGTCPQGKSRNITCFFLKLTPVLSHFDTPSLFPHCSCYSSWLSPSWKSECKIHLSDYAVCSFLPYIFLLCLLFLLFVPHFRGQASQWVKWQNVFSSYLSMSLLKCKLLSTPFWEKRKKKKKAYSCRCSKVMVIFPNWNSRLCVLASYTA